MNRHKRPYMGLAECHCKTCTNICRRRRSALMIALAIVIAIIAAIAANAQTSDTPGAPLCLYRPATIVLTDPLKRPIVAQGLDGAYIRPVDALSHLRGLHGATDAISRYDSASVAAQYSIAGAPVLGMISLSAWLGEQSPFPQRTMTLGALVRAYVLTGNAQQRQYYGYLLELALASKENDRCN